MILLIIIIGAILLAIALVCGAAGVILMGIVGYHKMISEVTSEQRTKAPSPPLKARAVLLGIFLHILPYAWLILILHGINTNSNVEMMIALSPIMLIMLNSWWTTLTDAIKKGKETRRAKALSRQRRV